MPAYPNAFGVLPETAIPGKPAYFWGSMPWTTDDMRMHVTSVAITTNVATVIGTIFTGNIPAVGNLISIQGTTTASGAFNISNVALASVSVTAAGVATLTLPLTHANVATTPDSGLALVKIQETSEALANSTSVAIYVPSQEPVDYGARSITVATLFPSLPTAATVTLYSAINDNTSEYTSMGVVATVAGSSQTVGPLVTFSTPAGRFFRLVVTGVSGGSSPTIISKMIP